MRQFQRVAHIRPFSPNRTSQNLYPPPTNQQYHLRQLQSASKAAAPVDLLSSLPAVAQTPSLPAEPSPQPQPMASVQPLPAPVAIQSEPVKIEVKEDDVALEFELLDAKMPIGNFTSSKHAKNTTKAA